MQIFLHELSEKLLTQIVLVRGRAFFQMATLDLCFYKGMKIVLSTVNKVDFPSSKIRRDGRTFRVPVVTYTGKKAMSVYGEILGEKHSYNRSHLLASL